MGNHVPDSARPAPETSPPPIPVEEILTGDTVICFMCDMYPAVELPHLGPVGRYKFFCSEPCAARHGLQAVKSSNHTWCSFCASWTDATGVCEWCDVRYTAMPTTEEADRVLEHLERWEAGHDEE